MWFKALAITVLGPAIVLHGFAVAVIGKRLYGSFQEVNLSFLEEE